MSAEDAHHDEPWSAFRGIVRYAFPLLLLLSTGFVVTVYLDYKGAIDIYPKSQQVYVCAVCGRKVGLHQLLVLQWQRYEDARSPDYCGLFVGDHEHVLVEDTDDGSIIVFAPRGHDVPMADPYVLKALPVLEGTPYLEPVVKALCDVDNYYAYVARDVLTLETLGLLRHGAPSTRPRLDQWWQENKQYFEIEHDPQKAVPGLKKIARQFHFGAYGARQTLGYHKRYGVPTIGAWAKLSAQENPGAAR